MGCGKSQAKAIPDANTLPERINKGLDEVKENLSLQLNDRKMLLQVLKALITYINKETQDPEFKTFFAYSLMGNHLLSTKAVQSYPPSMGRGIMALTQPEHLCYVNCHENFASRSAVLDKIRKASRGAGHDAQIGKEVRAAKLGILLGRAEVRAEKGHEMAAETTAAEDWAPVSGLSRWSAPGNEQDAGLLEAKRYAANKAVMLSVLEPYCDILEGLMSKKEEQLRSRFLQVTKLTEDDLKTIRRKLGVVAAIVKVFTPADARKDMKLPAFVGPESYGKSTLINHIVGRGVDSNIMPADPGMGTQVVCKVAPGASESCTLASEKQGSKKGNVRDMLSEINRTVKAKSEAGELGIRDMDMILAQKEFHTPVPMEFLDVPGIKVSTAFHTSLALNMATSLVLVCGKVEYLSTQLEEGGDLQLLTQIVRELSEPLPIQCVVSFKVQGAYFHSNRSKYVKLLKEKFPKCEIMEPLWMDFMATDSKGSPEMSQREKEKQVNAFMDSAALGLKRVLDPYTKFVACQDEINRFASALHTFCEQDLLEYRSHQDTAMRELGANISQYDSPGGQRLDEKLKQSMAFNVDDFLEDVKSSDNFPKFKVGTLSEVVNPVTIAQALMTDCRLAEMNWLLTHGRELHDQSFGEIYSPISELCGVSEVMPEQQQKGAAKIFIQRVSQAYENFNTQDDGKLVPDEHIQYWMKQCCCNIAPYIDTDPFAWFVTGFYIVAGDSKNKHALMSQIQKTRVYPRKWSFKTQMSDYLKSIQVDEWVQKCAGKKGNALMAAQFEVMEDCCAAFRGIAEESRFLNDVRKNDCMEELLEFIYVMAERILVKKRNNDSLMEWTDFAKWLKRNAGGPNQLKAMSFEMAKAESAEVADLCGDALALMRSSACSKWRQRIDEDLPEMLEKISTCSKRLQSIWSPSSSSGAALLISHSTKVAITKTTTLFGGQRCTFPETAEIVQHLTSSEACPVSVQDAPGPNLEDDFPADALGFIGQAGARVAMYLRRPDTQTYDPLDRERVMLEKLATQPNLTHLFVLWAPSQDTEWTVEKIPKWDITRGKVASYLRIELVATRQSFRCEDFLQNKVLPAMHKADADAKANFEKLDADVLKMATEFRTAVSEFLNDMENARSLTPAKFHDSMATEMRTKQRDRLKQLKTPSRGKKCKFEVPSKRFLSTVPEFTDKSIDVMAGDKTEGDGGKKNANVEVVNELYARAFLFNVMLGQVVGMSRALAGLAFQKLMDPLLNEIGAKFSMPGEDFINALGKYVTMRETGSGEAPPDPEVGNMRILLEMFNRDNFQHMYVGCVVYMLMPALYATVLPCVIDQDAAGASDKAYRFNIARARSMIGERAQWDELCKMIAETGANIKDLVRPYSLW